jgi:hypothetical protein
MATEKPDFPALEVQAHLAVCLACREFQRQLLRVEANVPRIPVPPTAAKARLLQQILQQPAAPMRPVVSRPPEVTGRWRSGLAWAGIAAAAVVLIAFGIWLGNWLSAPSDRGVSPPVAKGPDPMPKPPPDPFPRKDNKKPPAGAPDKSLVARLMAADLKLAEAETPRQQVEALAELADALQSETRLLSKSAPAAELNKLAALYKQVLHDPKGLVHKARDLARDLPMEDRQKVLEPIATQLTKTKRDAEQLAKTAPKSADALRVIAAAARDGDAELRALLQGGAE